MEKRKFLGEAKACTPKPHEFLDITKESEEEMSVGETNDDEAAGEGSAAEENNNTSAKSNPGNGGHLQTFLGMGENNDGELSSMDDKKSAEDVDLNEVDGFLNGDVQKEEDVEVNARVVGATVGVEAPVALFLSLHRILQWVAMIS
ncbi:hypothetical protein TB1_019152 [Malus domestica]